MEKQVSISFGPTAIFPDADNTSSQPSSVLSFGIVSFDQVRNDEICSFEYSDQWLVLGNAWHFDPDISFYRGRQYPAGNKSIFGMLSDSCPDRWGRTLLQRKEAQNAAKEQREPRKLEESDYLLGVSDATRMGALRFSLEDGVYPANDSEDAIPPWTRIRSLEHAAGLLEDGNASPEQLDYQLSLLLAPGSSLGGARPKSNVEDEHGGLWIAKFPSKSDGYDKGLAEFLTYKMAEDFELTTCESMAMPLSGHHHTFLIKRFDRKDGNRVHFASTMTLLSKTDGENAQRTSYLDIAEIIREHGAQPRKDLKELFKRIVFSIAVSNTDDHLRNHGFLLTEKGWRLSPLYNVNPNPYGRGLSLNVSEYDNSLNFEIAIAQAGSYGLGQKQAASIVDEVRLLVGGWEARAKKSGMKRSAIEALRPAFNVVR